jgi:hypothetical protein
MRLAIDTGLCWSWKGHPQYYQEQAAMVAVEAGVQIMPWCWIETTCGTPMCMEADHLLVHAPNRLEYPNGGCIYCGRPSGTRDHLLPVTSTGKALRRHILTVPACAECNSFIGDKHAPSITARRAIAKAGIRKKYKRKLNVHPYTDEEVAEFGPGLRPTILRAASEKQKILDRLAFPDDITYDIRYLGKSGIDDPYALGLLVAGGEEL